jgi:two-component system cell cycle sensor histidine kinase PleC
MSGAGASTHSANQDLLPSGADRTRGTVREKLQATVVWAAACVAAAMLADFVITILLLRDYQGYTPLITLCTATLVSVPTTYALVSGKQKLRKARDELAEARDIAIGANTAKTAFFANMSHELRTPLNAIIGFSQLLESDIFASRRVEYSQLIHGSAQHLLELVNELLDISKIEAGKVDLENVEVCLADCLQESCKLAEHRARSAGLHLMQNIQSDLPNVIGDPRALKQIALNILTNAIKFTPAGGAVELFASLQSSGEVAFGVRDEGIGIAPAEQQLVFERYGRASHRQTRDAEGTGLGLPIVKGLAEAHGGRVALESAVGEGTCITIWIPAARVCRKQKEALAS